MKTSIIKKYTQWVNEAESTTTPSSSTDQGGVTFISASSSASNITPALATKLGVEANKLYTIQLKSISQLTSIYNDGQFGGPKATASGIVMDKATATPTKAGEDILEINGKRISEAGAIVFNKAEIGGKAVTIKASGNGLLTLMRMGEGLSVMYTTHKNVLGYSKEYAIRFAIGGNVAEKDARGFSYWFAKPGQLEADSNGIALVVALAILKAAGYDDRIAKNDPVVLGWYNSCVKDKTPDQSIAASAEFLSKNLTKRMMLTQAQPTIATPWPLKDYKPLLKYTNEVMPIRTTETGKTAFAPIVTAVAAAIAPTAPPPGFGNESQAVLAAYADMIKTGLGSKARQVAYWLETSQQATDWKKGEQIPGASGTASANQKEGQFGPNKTGTPQN